MAADPFADHVVYNWDGSTACYSPGGSDNVTFGPFHSSGLWNDPQAVLGKPNALDFDDTGSGEFREINMVWPAWYQGTTQTSAANTSYWSNPTDAPKINNGCGLKGGAQIVVEFDEPITNDPHNPYGMDFVVHGNPFFATGNMVYKDSNMNSYLLSSYGGMGAGAVFEERVTISVAQSLEGPWYTYTTTFGDWFFPTQPVAWDREAINPNTGSAGDWTDQEQDWTKPVNPALADLASEAAAVGSSTWGYFGNRSVADALDLYSGSAGGTSLDLAESGFEWIKYVKFTDPDNKQGEICGVADVAPISIGDKQSMCWENVHETGQNILFFQSAADSSVNDATVEFNDITQVSHVGADAVSDLTEYDLITSPNLGAYLVEITAIFADEGETSFDINLSLRISDDYEGTGDDLLVLFWDGEDWQGMFPDSFDSTSMLMTLNELTEVSTFIITQWLEGDANRDGVVSAGDYAAVQANFGSTGPIGGLLMGDANGDGVVSAGDYASVQANFGNILGGEIASQVPEPTSLALLTIGMTALLRRKQ